MKNLIWLLLFSCFACQSAAKHHHSLSSSQEREMTVGIVQKEIYKGMSAAAVAQSLGSPNIVTTGEQGQEVWVYDKIATEASYSKSSGGMGAGVGGAVSSMLLGGLVNFGASTGASATTQKTLTVIIKFDETSQVRDFAYHASKF